MPLGQTHMRDAAGDTASDLLQQDRRMRDGEAFQRVYDALLNKP